MTTTNMKGRPCCVAPLEQHVFVGQDYLCVICGRPRALHADDGFVPNRMLDVEERKAIDAWRSK